MSPEKDTRLHTIYIYMPYLWAGPPILRGMAKLQIVPSQSEEDLNCGHSSLLSGKSLPGCNYRPKGLVTMDSPNLPPYAHDTE